MGWGVSGAMTVYLHEYVTGGGLAGLKLPPSWVAEGAAMRRALAQDFASLPGVRLTMTLDARWPDEPGPWTVIRVGPGEEAATFSRMAADTDCTLCVAPETDGLLQDRAETICRVGGTSLGSSPEAIALTGDKLQLAEHFETLGLPTPATRRVEPCRGLPRDVPYPAVLKPIDGAGALSTYYVRSPRDLLPEARALPEAVLQPFVAGRPISFSFLVGPEFLWYDAAEQRVICKRRQFSYRGGSTPVAYPEAARQAALAAITGVEGLRGWVGVDLIVTPDEKPVVIEINPRPTTSYVGLRRRYQPGSLAAAWLRGVAPSVLDDPSSLPIEFDADGTIRIQDRIHEQLF